MLTEQPPDDPNDQSPSRPQIRGPVVAAVALGVPLLVALVLLVLLLMSFRRIPPSAAPTGIPATTAPAFAPAMNR